MKRRVILSLAMVLLALPAAVFTLLASESGSSWLLGMASRAAGDRFNYESVQGTLLSGLQFSNLEFRAGDHQAKVAELEFRWRPRALVSGRLHLQRFSLSQVDYAAPEAARESDTADEAFEGLSLPLAIQVDDVSVVDVLIRRGGAENRIDHVVMQGFSVDGHILTLARLEVTADALELEAHGQVDPSPPHAVKAGIAWSLRLPDGAKVKGAGNVSGTLEAIRFDHSLNQPFALSVSGTVSPLADPLVLDLSGEWKSLRWPLKGTPEFSSASGSFSARGSLQQLTLNLDASLDSESIPARRLRIEADVKSPAADIEASLRWTALLADGKEAKGGGIVRARGKQAEIDHSLELPVQIATRGKINLAGEAPEFSLNGEWRELAWPLTGEAAVSSESGRYRLSGVPQAVRFEVDAALRSKAAQIEQMDLQLEGTASAEAPFPFDAKLRFNAKLPQNIAGSGGVTVKGDAKRIEVDGSFEQPLALIARGQISLASSVPEIDLSGNWKDLRWPLSGEAEFQSANGKFTVSGPVQQLALKLEASASGRRLPPADTRLEARVRPKGARIQALSIKTLGGEIRTRGDVGWQPVPSWKLQLEASGLKPELYFNQWPGEIAVSAGITGEVEAGAIKLSMDALKLDGRLRGHPVEGRGAISVDGAKVTATNLKLRSGDNRVEINGDAGDRLNMSFAVNAPALSAVAPELKGNLEGHGRLSGSRAQPSVVAKLSGSDLGWKDQSVSALSLDVDAGTASGYRSRIAVEARGVQAHNLHLGNVSLSGDGTPEQHRLMLSMTAPAASLSAEASGSYRGRSWSGTLDSAVKSKDFGEWRTPRSAALTAGQDRFQLDNFCLAQTAGRVCASGRWQAQDDAITASGEIVNLPLGLARPFLPEGLRVEGALNGRFKAGGKLSAPEAEARIDAGAGKFIYEPGAGFDSANFDYRDGRIDVRYAPEGSQLQAAVELENAGSVRSNIEIGAFPKQGSPPLKGRIEADFSDLRWIGVMVPQLVDVRGNLNGAVDIRGTVEDPSVTGMLALKNGETNLPDLGLELRQINFELRSEKAGQIVVKGALGSGGGRLEINGRSKLLPKERRLDLEIKGSEFEVARLPTVHAFISPDLKLNADEKIADLTGGVHIPRATVKLNEVPQTATKVSEDEVIVNALDKNPSQKQRRGPLMRMNVDVSLGDEVRFDGFGLSTRIDGKLTLSGETGQAPRAQGVLSLREGRYEAYGQDLKIKTGRLLFAGPIDNPGIDVTAVRELQDVTAGIVVSGNVKSISSGVYSEPSLPEAEAFSYLLTGKPLSSGSENDAAKLQQAAAALGLDRAQIITQQIGNKLGLDELTVGGGVDQTSLLLGKQITPDIFVRYALGVFEQSGRLLLDYRLTDSVSVRAESGEQQGMDIIYKIEREKLF